MSHILRRTPDLRAPRKYAYAEPRHRARDPVSGSARSRPSGAPQHHLGGALGTMNGSILTASCECPGRSRSVLKRALHCRYRGRSGRACVGWDGTKEQGDASPAVRVQRTYRRVKKEVSRWMWGAQRGAAKCVRPSRLVEPRLARALRPSATTSDEGCGVFSSAQRPETFYGLQWGGCSTITPYPPAAITAE